MKILPKAKVYMDFINYRGEVTESHLIATFMSVNWAKEFTNIAEDSVKEDPLCKIRLELDN